MSTSKRTDRERSPTKSTPTPVLRARVKKERPPATARAAERPGKGNASDAPPTASRAYRAARDKHATPAAAVSTRTSTGRFARGYSPNPFGRPPKPRPPTVDFFHGLPQRVIASNPFLAAAAKAIPIAAGGTTVGIEGVALQMMSNAIKQHYQAGREFSRSFRSELKAALKESKEDWYRRMRLKIILTADIIRSKKTHWPSVALLAQDPRQIIWTDEDDVVRIKTVALAERIRKLTRMEPTLRNEVEALVGQVRAAKTAEDRDRCHRKIQERVMLVNELLSYGIRERPNAEKIVRVLAEQYLADGRDPVSGWKFEDWSD